MVTLWAPVGLHWVLPRVEIKIGLFLFIHELQVLKPAEGDQSWEGTEVCQMHSAGNGGRWGLGEGDGTGLSLSQTQRETGGKGTGHNL